MLNEKRIKRAMKASYKKAHEALADARESGSEFSKRVAFEVVCEVRRMNAERRRALRLGRPV